MADLGLALMEKNWFYNKCNVHKDVLLKYY